MRALLLGDLCPTERNSDLFVQGDMDALFSDTLSLMLCVNVDRGLHVPGISRSFAVFRCIGIAHRLAVLFSALEEILKLQGVVNLYACITYPNTYSVAMHEAFGFKYIGRFHSAGFKFGIWRDVSWFEKQIGFPSEPSPVIPYPALNENEINFILRNN